jgi:hypothetical protein
MTPAGIERAIFRFVAQHLNRCATAVRTLKMEITYNLCTFARFGVQCIDISAFMCQYLFINYQLSKVKVKGRVWGLFGTAACKAIVPLPPTSSPQSSPEAPRTT